MANGVVVQMKADKAVWACPPSRVKPSPGDDAASFISLPSARWVKNIECHCVVARVGSALDYARRI